LLPPLPLRNCGIGVVIKKFCKFKVHAQLQFYKKLSL